jgi:NitT/TauT family transport system permease protein
MVMGLFLELIMSDINENKILNKLFFYYRKTIAVILFFTLWEAAPKLGFVNSTFIPPLSEVLVMFWNLLITGRLHVHLLLSLQRAVLGLIIASLIGLPLGFLLGGWFKRFEEYLNPLLNILAQVNPFSVFPVFVLLFGIGEVAKVAIILWVCVWPILFGTINGVKNIDPILVKAAIGMGTSKVVLFRKIVLPGAASGIFSGIKQGAGIAFFMLIAAEMIGASAGLGFLILNAQHNFQIKRLFVAVITIALLGLFITWSISTLEKKIITWKEETVVRSKCR